MLNFAPDLLPEKKSDTAVLFQVFDGGKHGRVDTGQLIKGKRALLQVEKILVVNALGNRQADHLAEQDSALTDEGCVAPDVVGLFNRRPRLLFRVGSQYHFDRNIIFVPGEGVIVRVAGLKPLPDEILVQSLDMAVSFNKAGDRVVEWAHQFIFYVGLCIPTLVPVHRSNLFNKSHNGKRDSHGLSLAEIMGRKVNIGRLRPSRSGEPFLQASPAEGMATDISDALAG